MAKNKRNNKNNYELKLKFNESKSNKKGTNKAPASNKNNNKGNKYKSNNRGSNKASGSNNRKFNYQKGSSSKKQNASLKINQNEKDEKNYSTYINDKSEELNKIPVEKGSIIVANLSDYEKLPSNIKDHKRESVVVLKGEDDDLGVVYLHGLTDAAGNSRMYKKDAGLWETIKKKDQEVFVDLDIRENDVKGNPIKQGEIFKNTGVILEDDQMEKVENHIYGSKKKRSHKEIVKNNRKIRENKKSG